MNLSVLVRAFDHISRLLNTHRYRATATLGVLAAMAAVTAVVQVGAEDARRMAAGPAQGLRQVADAHARLPLAFVSNQGQTDERVRYLAHGNRYGFFFTSDSLAISLLRQDGAAGVNLFLDFIDANPEVSMTAANPATSTVSYLRTGSAADSRSGLPTYGEIVYRDLWPGVDMAVLGRDGALKYEFRLAPGARVDDIRLAYRGTDGLTTGENGELLIDTALGVLRDTAPVSYQIVDGRRMPVESSYLLAAGA